MQPYFVPYAGYFRLFQAADVFVIYDCVQFPRRGWVHRNQLPGHDQALRWLTLPLDKVERDAPIHALRFPRDAEHRLVTQFPRFPALSKLGEHCPALSTALTALGVTPVDYLERLLHVICADLHLPCRTIRSSQLSIAETLRGQDRIIAIAKHLGAHTYVNSPGGRSLYAHKNFEESNLQLRFLTPYSGSTVSILQRILDQGPESVGEEIRRDTHLEA
jgi:hypothetical protein